MIHKPVLLNEVLNILDPQSGQFFIDGTLGGGGHAKKVVERLTPKGIFLGIDRDSKTLKDAKEELESLISEENLDINLLIEPCDFKDTNQLIKEKKLGKADCLLLDLGFSSMQLESGKGFSFKRDEPLIMRYDGKVDELTAARVLNEFDEKTLARLLKDFGEERFADRIANSISKQRREKSLRTTFDLVEAVKRAVPGSGKSKIHPATKTFMALRIFVNDEFGSLKDILDSLPEFMKKNSKIAVISFHSLEDKIVRRHFGKMKELGTAEYINKDPITPTKEEIFNNPRSRSAKLRAIKLS
ncbi:MAG: 16S rRNA (cytosine(1402)-N(4))-methyltransferase RsmH [Candidatus Paceibacterota bacterium]